MGLLQCGQQIEPSVWVACKYCVCISTCAHTHMILWMVYICFYTNYVPKTSLANLSVAKQYVMIPSIFAQTVSAKLQIWASFVICRSSPCINPIWKIEFANGNSMQLSAVIHEEIKFGVSHNIISSRVVAGVFRADISRILQLGWYEFLSPTPKQYVR